ncbi:hypothetical protein D3C78_1452350 [compost metagenome]
MQARQQPADFLAVMGVGLPFVATGQARLQQCGLAFQLAQGLAILGTHGVGHRQVGGMQHIEQGDEERQVLRRTALDQGQDVLAMLQADEEVAVLRTFGDATEVLQTTQSIGGQEFFQHRTLKGGEYRHDQSSNALDGLRVTR